MDLPKRKSTRLKKYDYSLPGIYFVTICTRDRRCLFWNVGEGLAPPDQRLSRCGNIAEEQIQKIEQRYPFVKIEHYVIMPNHIHILLSLKNTGGASPSPTLSQIIGTFKSLTSRLSGNTPLFQRSFHDHIVRNETDYRQIWNYIDTNPLKWETDCFYIAE